MQINGARWIALALLGFCSTSAFGDIGAIGPASATIGRIGGGTALMGGRATSTLKMGSIAPVKAMDAGLVGPSTNNYISTIGEPPFRGTTLRLPAAAIGNIGHSTMRQGMIGPRSVDLLPRGDGSLPR